MARVFSRLPFWLLIAAWFCANMPQTAAWHGIQWLKNAEHFTHQTQLRAEVASLLMGRKAPSAPWLNAAPERAQKSPAAWAADITVKKILLWGDLSASALIVPRLASAWCVLAARPPAAPSSDVPHPPPKSVG